MSKFNIITGDVLTLTRANPNSTWNLSKGSKVTAISSYSGDSPTAYVDVKSKNINQVVSIYAKYLKKSELTIEALEKEVIVHKRALQGAQDRIKFIKESGFDKFDENQYRCWKALDVIEGTDDKKKKVTELAKLLK